MGLNRDEIICYEANPHGNTGNTTITNPHGSKEETAKVESNNGLSGSQIGGIAGGVSAVVVIALAVGAWVMVRRRRAAKAKAATAAAASGSASSLPTYYAPGQHLDEKRQMSETA